MSVNTKLLRTSLAGLFFVVLATLQTFNAFNLSILHNESVFTTMYFGVVAVGLAVTFWKIFAIDRGNEDITRTTNVVSAIAAAGVIGYTMLYVPTFVIGFPSTIIDMFF